MPDALVERDGSTLIVTMNRPHRKNAQSGAMLARMYDAWVEASTNDDIRCIILTGAEGNFSSGADLRAMAGDSQIAIDAGMNDYLTKPVRTPSLDAMLHRWITARPDLVSLQPCEDIA